jgi:1-acyl-sn-glycerol-3-phosphate acyltransferase
MLSFLPGRLRGVLSFFLILLNTIVIFIPVMFIAMLKLAIPVYRVQNFFSKILITIASKWVECNAGIFRLMNKIQWKVIETGNLTNDEWSLVISNHQSWVDIFVIQTVLLHKVPYIKFFLKKELIWVPLMGLAWWALDFPFMKRYSRKFLKKYPHLKGKDVEITRKACKKFKIKPISIMNFVEGTRFTQKKHNQQQSPFTYLLKPKAGGIAFVLGAMGDYLNNLLNITIAYPEGVGSFWDFLCGRITKIRVHIEKMPITNDILGDYDNNQEYRTYFQNWTNDLWAKKDVKIKQLLEDNV